jgi:hypothetical protein
MELLKDLIVKVVGFVIGALAGVIVMIVAYQILELIAGSTSGGHVRYRVPIGFFILPIITGVIGWLVFPTLNYKKIYLNVKRFPSKFKQDFWKYSKFLRLVVVFPVFWMITVFLYISFFNPFGYSISSKEWMSIFRIILFPSLLLAIVYFSYTRFIDKK